MDRIKPQNGWQDKTEHEIKASHNGPCHKETTRHRERARERERVWSTLNHHMSHLS